MNKISKTIEANYSSLTKFNPLPKVTDLYDLVNFKSIEQLFSDKNLSCSICDEPISKEYFVELFWKEFVSQICSEEKGNFELNCLKGLKLITTFDYDIEVRYWSDKLFRFSCWYEFFNIFTLINCSLGRFEFANGTSFEIYKQPINNNKGEKNN